MEVSTSNEERAAQKSKYVLYPSRTGEFPFWMEENPVRLNLSVMI